MSWLFECFVIEGYGLLIDGSKPASGNEQGFLVGIDVTTCELFDHSSESGI